MRHQAVHAHDEHVLIMRAVEDHHFAFPRRSKMGAPEEIVGQLKFARLFEAENRGPLRVHAAKQVAHDPILAGSIERLQHDEQRLVAVCIKEVLQLVHALHVLSNRGHGLLVRCVLAVAGSASATMLPADLLASEGTHQHCRSIICQKSAQHHGLH